MVSKSAAKQPPPPPATAQFPLLSYRPNPQGRRAGGQLQSGSHAEPVPKEPESPGEFPLLASEPGKKPGAVSIWSVSIYFRFLVPPKGVESSGPFPFTKSTKGGLRADPPSMAPLAVPWVPPQPGDREEEEKLGVEGKGKNQYKRGRNKRGQDAKEGELGIEQGR